MAPAFGLIEARGMLPYFSQSVTKVGDRLTSIQYRDRYVLPVVGRQMVRVDQRRGLRGILDHRRVVVARQSDP